MRLLLAAALFAAGEAAACDRLLAIIGSYHFDQRGQNEVQLPSLGCSQQWSEVWRGAGIFYRNSERSTSVFLGAAWEPLRWGDTRFGIMAGPVSGYRKSSVLPLLAFTASTRVDSRHYVDVGLIPVDAPKMDKAVAFLMLELRRDPLK